MSPDEIDHFEATFLGSVFTKRLANSVALKLATALPYHWRNRLICRQKQSGGLWELLWFVVG
jgi:hypothetical protein